MAALLGASLLALTTVVVVPPADAFLHSRQHVSEIEQLREVLASANQISAERAPANVIMSLPPGGDPAAAATLRTFRSASDRALARLGERQNLAARVETVAALLRAARREVDRVAARPVATRGARDVQDAILAMFGVRDALQEIIASGIRDLGRAHSDLLGPALIAEAVSELREHGGRLGSYLVPALATGEPLGPQRVAEVLEASGRVRATWQMLRVQAPFEALADLVQAVETRFIGEGLGLIETTIAEVQGPGPFALTPDALTRRYVPLLRPLEELRSAYLDRLMLIVTQDQDAARTHLVLVACGTGGLLLLLAGLLQSLRTDVLLPLLAARQAIVALAEERPIQPPPARFRIREMRGLHDAILVLQARMGERARLMQNLRQQADTDELTGLSNRRGLARELAALGNRTGAEAADGTGLAAMLAIDLDGFKRVNDSFGHEAGDGLVRLTGQRLQAIAGGDGLVARMGGDEFAILLRSVTGPEEGARLARTILASLAEPFRVAGQILHVGASIGVAVAPRPGAAVEDLVARADTALYAAKRAGRHCYRLFDPEMRQARISWTARQQEMPRALAESEFVLFYQPQLRLSDQAIIGAEALIRWRHPQLGLLTPAAFLAPLERSRLADEVGLWVLRTACAQAASWRRWGLRDLRVAVNLFSRQFRSPHVVEQVREVLADTGLPASCLELEITETIILEHDEALLAPLRALRDLGVGLAFDDFGTGYASLSHLKRFPLTRLKIDRSFVRGLPDSPQDLAIVRSIMALGRSFGLEVTAEGIETPAVLRCLALEGCEEGQGYLFGEPMTAELFAAKCWESERTSAPISRLSA
ncbi:putative bifunctional diguanylate cyclase/phosphodiesterase [Methylobacterium sp. JK268]